MRIERVVPRGLNEEKGAILLIVIVFMMALTITGLALLHATVLEHSLAMREVYKNQAFYLADGGIEHLRLKLYSFGGHQAIKEMDPVSGGHDGEYRPAIGVTSSGEGDYWVEHYEGSSGYAISTGQITKGDREILRRIKIRIYESGLFDYGIFADKGIRMTGVGEDYKVRSWHSTIPGYATNEAVIGTNANWAKALDLQNSQIDGSAEVGPGAIIDDSNESAISLGPNGIITEGKGWLSEKRRMAIYVPEGVESLTAMDPLAVAGAQMTISGNGYYPSITVQGITQEQAADGSPPAYSVEPAPMVVGSETIWIEARDPITQDVVSKTPMERVADYTINYDTGKIDFTQAIASSTGENTNYIVTMIKGSLVIDGDYLLKVDTLRVMGGGSIVIDSDDYLTLYITQEMRSMGGGIVNDSKVPSHLRIYGGADCTAIDIGGTPDFYGVVYAPNANIDCNGTGDIYGSVVGDFVRVLGTPIIYYDVALQDDPSLPVLTVLRNWEEIS